MEKSRKVVAQIYGYTICLVAVITLLITITTFVNALFDLQDPLHAGSKFQGLQGGPSLASFENYKMDVLKPQRSFQRNEGADEVSYVPDEKALNTMYEAARANKIQSVKHSAHQSLTISSMLIVICCLLFVTHWRWVNKIRTESVS